VMKDPRKTVKDYAVSQYPRPQNSIESTRLGWSKGEFMGYSLRTERYRYTVWMKDFFRSNKPFDPKLIAADELYDYEKDPDERVNVVDEKEYASIYKDMHARMIEFFYAQAEKLKNR
jgi:iduronate 2-sulfatase